MNHFPIPFLSQDGFKESLDLLDGKPAVSYHEFGVQTWVMQLIPWTEIQFQSKSMLVFCTCSQILIQPQINVCQVANVVDIPYSLPDIWLTWVKELSFVSQCQNVEDAVNMGRRCEIESCSNVFPFLFIDSLFVFPVFLFLMRLLSFPKHQVIVYFLTQRCYNLLSNWEFTLRVHPKLTGNYKISQSLGSFIEIIIIGEILL